MDGKLFLSFCAASIVIAVTIFDLRTEFLNVANIFIESM